MRFEAHRHARRIGADDAAAQHHHFRRQHARHAAEQHAASALRDLEAMRTGLDRHASGHFAHRRQQRQAAARIRHRFIGDGDRAGFQQSFGLLGIGRQMQIGEKRLALAQALDLDRLRLLHLHDHVGDGEDLVRIRQDRGADALVVFVVEADRFARHGLDEHGMTARGQLAHGGRRQADAVFVIFDFLGNTNAHENLAKDCVTSGSSLREAPETGRRRIPLRPNSAAPADRWSDSSSAARRYSECRSRLSPRQAPRARITKSSDLRTITIGVPPARSGSLCGREASKGKCAVKLASAHKRRSPL